MSCLRLNEILNQKLIEEVLDSDIKKAENEVFLYPEHYIEVIHSFEYNRDSETKIMNNFLNDFKSFCKTDIIPAIKEYEELNSSCQYHLYCKYISADENQIKDNYAFFIKVLIANKEPISEFYYKDEVSKYD